MRRRVREVRGGLQSIGNDSSTVKKITEKIGKEKDSRETRACQKKRQIFISKRKKKETS